MERSIIHLNIADFAVAVERIIDHRLTDRPIIIAPGKASRTAVYDMSDEAYLAGIRKGMMLGRAMRLCRDAAVIPPHPDRYDRAMQSLLKQALPYSPLIESGDGDGHLFVDITGTHRLLGPPMDVAWRLHRQIKNNMGLNPIWSVAPNKLVAKVASRLVKPVGEYIVGSGDESAVLAPLPLCLLPGIEKKDMVRLHEFNLTHIFQVTALSLEQLQLPFGRRAPFIYETVRGIDASPVSPLGQSPPVISVEHEFSEDTNETPVLKRHLYRLVEQAGHCLRKRRLAARRIGIFLNYTDGRRCIRQARADPASANDLDLFETAGRALSAAWKRRVRIRHMRLVFDRLVFPPAQIALFETDRQHSEKRNGIVGAMDTIRHRFGPGAIQMGRSLAA